MTMFRPETRRVWWSPYPQEEGASRPRRPSRISDYYEDGKLKPYPGTVADHYWFGLLWLYHKKAAKLALRLEDDGYKIPPGVRYVMRQTLTWNQLASKFPWAVYLVTRKGKRVRFKRQTVASAVELHRRLVRKYPTATIVSIRRSYDIPPKYRGRLPTPWKWCPQCLKPRKFKRVYLSTGEPRTFYARVKYWSETKQRWDEAERKLAVMRCPLCGCTNQDPVFRRSNQPYHIRQLRRGARRVKTPNPQRRKKVNDHLYLMKPGKKRRRNNGE